MRVPSGEKLGNPLFGVPFVRSFVCRDPSARTIITFAGLASRAPKNAPNPNAIHWPSGDHVGTNAAPAGSEKTTFLFEPSAFITEIDALPVVARFLMSLIARRPSRENCGNTSV